MNSKLVFLSNYLKKPKEIAALVPSSRYVVNRILDMVDFKGAKYIVEYGPGIGNITKKLLENMGPYSKLFVFEINEDFCSLMKSKINDGRLIVINDSADKLGIYLKKFKIKNVDYVISGIPFSLMKEDNKIGIIKETNKYLKYGGKFIVYQFSLHCKRYLSMPFKKISQKLEVRNFLPYFVFACEKT